MASERRKRQRKVSLSLFFSVQNFSPLSRLETGAKLTGRLCRCWSMLTDILKKRNRERKKKSSLSLVCPAAAVRKRKREKVEGERSVGLEIIFFVFLFLSFSICSFLFFFPMPVSLSRALLRGLGHPFPDEIKGLRELVEWLEHTKVRAASRRKGIGIVFSTAGLGRRWLNLDSVS